jgi:transcription initiation factor TFIIIB Brf1 subunit/transcription initiation factor TFIIB
MGQAVGTEQCPKCAKDGRDVHRDNLARYSDGSAFCFCCGYTIYSNAISRLQETRRRTTNSKSKFNQCCYLPEDSTGEIPEIAWTWLKEYALTETDIKTNNILWSEENQMLIFPLLIEEELVAWHGRYFGKESKPKATTKGSLKDVYYMKGNPSTDTIVLVEDLISAIRIGKSNNIAAMPIFGSVIKLKQLLTLHNRYKNILIWLDKNKEAYSRKISFQARQLGINAYSIISELDPKCYNDDNIKSFLKT